MQVGLYFDLRNPPPWHRPWGDFYAQTLEWIEEAERQGADAVWTTEHHFFEDGYLPKPLTFSAAIAARTKRVRIGTAVVLAPLHPAVGIAEDAAIVDLLSRGRLELGLGAGYVRPEFDAYGVDREQRFDLTDACIEEVRRRLDGDGVTPPPEQRPFPIWAGYLGPLGARRAGRLGVGLLNTRRNCVESYRAGLAEAGHDPATARLGTNINLLCADDPDEAFERVLPHLAYQLNSYRRGNAAGSAKTPRELGVDELREGRGSGPLAALQVMRVEDAAKFVLEQTRDLPVEHVYLWASIAGMPDDLVARHIELVSTQLRTALRDADAASEVRTGADRSS